VETDKVNVEIGAPDEGVLNGISTRDGDFVEFGSVFAIIARKMRLLPSGAAGLCLVARSFKASQTD
jgi:pyruvate/2-oxoglutarate dehydrogenase complex dihydrolipoamide acyltransferase (E2) component